MKFMALIFFVFTLMSCGDNEEDSPLKTNPDFNEETTGLGNTGESSDSNSTESQVATSNSEETFTITNKTFLLVTVASGSFSQYFVKGECVILTRSQFATLKIQSHTVNEVVADESGRVFCDNTHGNKKCPGPNNYNVTQSQLPIYNDQDNERRWRLKVSPANKKAENCKTFS